MDDRPLDFEFFRLAAALDKRMQTYSETFRTLKAKHDRGVEPSSEELHTLNNQFTELMKATEAVKARLSNGQ
jgi:hypothetical protein